MKFCPYLVKFAQIMIFSTLRMGQKNCLRFLDGEELIFAVDQCQCPETPDFAQIFHIAARKIMLLPKYVLVTARKI